MDKNLLSYRLKSLAVTIAAVVAASLALIFIYSLVFNDTTRDLLAGAPESAIEFGISVITITAPLFAIVETLISWLRNYRENRRKTELIKVVEALSQSAAGMDFSALERDSGLPKKILLERINELILLGRVAVKITAGHNREYSLK